MASTTTSGVVSLLLIQFLGSLLQLLLTSWLSQVLCDDRPRIGLVVVYSSFCVRRLRVFCSVVARLFYGVNGNGMQFTIILLPEPASLSLGREGIWIG